MIGQLRSVAHQVHRLFLPAVLIVAAFVVTTVYRLFGPITALKGTYALVGLVTAIVLYYGFPQDQKTGTTGTRFRRWGAKGVVLMVLLSLSYTLLVRDRALVLLVGIPIGYAFLGLQYVNHQPPKKLVPQIALLFALSPLTKALTTVFYFGGGDLLARIAEIQQMLDLGNIAAIGGRYEHWPGLHILVGGITAVTGLGVNDALLLAGAITYAGLVIGTYTLAKQATDHSEMAVSVTVTVSFLAILHHYSSFFVAQSLAVALVVFLMLVALRLAERQSQRLHMVSLVLVLAIVVTHHFTLVLLVPLLGVLIATGIAIGRDVVHSRRFIAPFVLLSLAALVHWTFSGRAWFFFQQLIVAFVDLLSLGNFIGVSRSADPVVYGFGTTVPIETVRTVIVFPPYVYSALLTVLFSLGAVSFLRHYARYRQFGSMLFAGFVGSLAIFNTPLSVKGLDRLAHLFAVPFSFVLGIGLFHLRRSLGSDLGRVIILGLIVIGGTFGPMTAADDLDKFSSNPQRQQSFNGAEFQQLEASSEFYRNHGKQVSAFWISRITIQYFGASDVGQASVNKSGFSSDGGLFLYRRAWTDHEVRFSINPRFQGKMYLSEEYLNHSIARKNKVFETGTVGYTWSKNQTVS